MPGCFGCVPQTIRVTDAEHVHADAAAKRGCGFAALLPALLLLIYNATLAVSKRGYLYQLPSCCPSRTLCMPCLLLLCAGSDDDDMDDDESDLLPDDPYHLPVNHEITLQVSTPGHLCVLRQAPTCNNSAAWLISAPAPLLSAPVCRLSKMPCRRRAPTMLTACVL
jgi:hypothetical protein